MSLELQQASRAGSRNAHEAISRRGPRVLHVGKFYPPHMGGIETHLEVLCRELKNYLDVRVLVAGDSRNTVEEVRDEIPLTRVGTVLTAFSTPICPAMVSRIRASNADLVHIHVPNPGAVLAYLASGHRGPLVVTYHSDTVKQKLLGPLFEPWLHALLRRSAAIVVTSPNYLNSSAVLQAHRDRCHVIPFGIPVSEFEQCELSAVEPIRQQHGERLVIAVGRLVYYKGFQHLIRAMAEVRGKLLIVGVGPLRRELQNLAVELGVNHKVVFLGNVPGSLAPYYHAANVFSLPSVARSEAFGIVQIEAMAAGLPVVNTSLDSGVPFVSLHQQTGLTVPPGDPRALAGALNLILDDASLRKSFGLAARERARQEFSLETMVNRTRQLYDSVFERTVANR